MDAFDLLDAPVSQGDAFDNLGYEFQEPGWKSAIRTASQYPQGRLEMSPHGLAAQAWQLLAQGEVLDPEEIDRIKAISEREGIPFDEESYMEAAQQALRTVPTVSNIASGLESSIGIPLEPKTEFQKNIRLGAGASKLFSGQGIAPQIAAGVGAPAIKESQILAGRSEPVAEMLAYGVARPSPTQGANISLTKSKPSGMPERYYENLKKPTEVSAKKLDQIQFKLENDFRKVSDQIIKEAPIGETASELAKNPNYIRDVENAFQETASLAKNYSNTVPADDLRSVMQGRARKNIEGFSLSEYDKNYLKFSAEQAADILTDEISATQLVEQYRKNNKALGEYFEPGSSKALNYAKRDALLDANRSIADILEKHYPELYKPFAENNKNWSMIQDAQFVDDLINDIFKDKSVNFQKVNSVFTSKGMDKKLTRALGQEGYDNFVQAITDLNSTKKPLSLLRVAKEKGFGDFASTAISYVLHPKLGYAKAGLDAVKYAYNKLIQAVADKPKIGINFSKSFENLKKGNFAKAASNMEAVEAELQVSPKPTEKAKTVETVDITPKTETKQLEAPKKQIEYKEPNEPIYLSYTPPKLPEAPPKPSTSSKIFSDVINEVATTPKSKESLKKINVSLSTRNQGQQFHGTKQPIDKLNENIFDTSNPQNIYGAGFYTTDALDIADGYSKSSFAKDSIVYKVKEKTPQKIYDAEKPIDEFIKLLEKSQDRKLNYLKERRPNAVDVSYTKSGKLNKKQNKDLTIEDYIGDNPIYKIIEEEKPKNLRELYDAYRDRTETASDFQENLVQIQDILEHAGYDGISHQGGLLTNNPKHTVKIYWRPENLEIEQFYYPKMKPAKKTEQTYQSINKIQTPTRSIKSKEPIQNAKPQLQESKGLPKEKKQPKKDEVKPKKMQKESVEWNLPDQKKPFAYSTTAESNGIEALIADIPNPTFKKVYNRLNYAPKEKEIVKHFIDNGYGDQVLELTETGQIKALKPIKKKK